MARSKIPDAGTLSFIKRLFVEQGLAYRGRYALALVFMGVSAAATSLTAYLFGDFINVVYERGDFSLVLALAAVVFGLFALKGLATYIHQVILQRIANSILAENQRRMFAKLMRENIAFFADRHSSEFLARMTAGATAVTQILNLVISAVGRDLLTLIGLAAVMVYQDPIMSLFGFVVAPPALIVLRKMVKRVRGLAHSQFTGGTRILETMQESLQGLRTVKAFTLEDTMTARLDAHVGAVQRDSDKMAKVFFRASPLMETLGGLAVAAALTYGGYRIIEGGAKPGEFVSFVMAFLLAYEPAKRLARLNLELNSAVVGAKMLFDVLDSPESEARDDNRPPLELKEARVELRNVTFAYRPGETVLNRMSFIAEPGKVTALVGPSGGGKSTVLNLLLRFYEATDGAVLIDGQNIANVSRASLRKQTAYVGQDVFMFRGTIRDNIAFGRPNATQAEIEAAAQAACAHDFIMSFPQGYDTGVGEHGAQLSGGQRQRIAVARALIKDAPLILLDEATASLDSESERQVQEAIEHLCQGRTTIVIAHRLHTIMHADRILVIEGGDIVESGKHDDLLRKGGRYASFFRLQQLDGGLLKPAVSA